MKFAATTILTAHDESLKVAPKRLIPCIFKDLLQVNVGNMRGGILLEINGADSSGLLQGLCAADALGQERVLF